MASHPSQPCPVVDQVSQQAADLVDGGGEPRRPEDVGLWDLQAANVAQAIAFGIVAGDAAIRDVLSSGALGILGPKR